MSRLLAGIPLIALLACAPRATTVPPTGRAAEGPRRVELTVLGTTDVHGRLLPWDYYRAQEEDRGLARVATLIDSIRASDPNVILLDSGDLLEGNSLDTYYGVVAPADVHPVIRAMNLLNYDAAAIGNHEFNYGIPALERAVSKAEFPFLAGNVFVAGTDSLRWPATTILTRDGVRIGILGLTTPGSAIWDRAHVEGKLEFADLVASARRWWPELEARSDVQVAIVHSGLGPGSSYDAASTGVPEENAGRELAEALPGLDLVLLGHTHREIPADTVGGVLLVQAGRWGEALAVAHLELEHAADGWQVVDARSSLLHAAGVAPDPSFVAALEPYHEKVLAYVADTIGWTPERWSASGARLEDSPILDLIQRVQLDATGADLSAASVFNDRATLGPGPITVADAAGLYVYDNTLKAIRVTGKQLRHYLERSAGYFHRVKADGSLAEGVRDEDLFVDSIPGYDYDVVAGVDYAIDLTRPVGDRIRNLTFHGSPVEDGQVFTLAINNYRQEGGGGFSMIAGAPVVYDHQEDVRQLLIDWIRTRDTVRQADVYVPSWGLLPARAATRFLADTVPWRPSPAGADSARIAVVAGRENERLAGEGRSRVPTAEGGAAPGGALAARLDSLPPPLPASSDSVRLAIATTNDFHGALEPVAPAWAAGDTLGGAAVLAGYLDAVAGRYPGAEIHVDAGDLMQGTVVSNLTGGRSTIDFFDTVGLDAAAIGNHEFDWTIDSLRARIDDARFPWLTANVFVKDTGKRPDWAEPWAMLDVAGLKVAVIGATTRKTPWVTLPQNVTSLEFRDIAQVVNELVPEVRRRGADLVVLTIHAGAFRQSSGEYAGEIVDVARRITAPVDLIVSGHTHTRFTTEVNGIPVLQAGSSGTAVGVVVLTWDRARHAVVDRELRVWTTRREEVRPDPRVAALVGRWSEKVDSIADRPIATLATPLARDRHADRARETALGDLIADAQRAATETQIAVTNAGGIRADLPAGPITYREVFAVQPFENSLIRLTLSGEQLSRLLDAVVADAVGQVSGVRMRFDPARAPGERVIEATLEDSGELVIRDGRVVHPDSTYSVVVNNFMASGGDTYAVLKEAREAENTGLIDSEVLADYLQRLPQPVHASLAGRLQRLGPWPEGGRGH